jgi:demethylmenaquinone methyltransferase/2-methoxy-6-polyprenyl-1,4-benzoquinol methylase
VPTEEKEKLVQEVFSSVANRYDLMNDLMSFGLHRLWKKHLIRAINPCGYEHLLDVAGGTGDIAQGFLTAGGSQATVCDLNQEMLEAGRKKYPDTAMTWVHGNAEILPFDDDIFDLYTISFGIRNVSNINQVLCEAYRVLKPGGRFFCLEFSQVTMPILRKIYDIYSFSIIPKIGGIIAQDQESYQYLVESIKLFPAAPRLASMIQEAGFCQVSYEKLTFGVVAIHTGVKE